jgi:hypothetical protein
MSVKREVTLNVQFLLGITLAVYLSLLRIIL